MSRQQDEFFYFKNAAIAKIREVFEWAHKHAMRTDVCFWERGDLNKRLAEEPFEQVIRYVNRKAKPYFRVILRKNQNWFLLLSDKKHVEDLIEIFIRGIAVGQREYFVSCFLKKEWMPKLKEKFSLRQIGGDA